ncbi:Histidine kinase (plasmid) [Rhodovastum atsumiense]|nr:ATP-binding protein [Rhodovastum atsumiense]CAH2605634.1 Histidine kinase [Rhodovastum atsumiense]
MSGFFETGVRGRVRLAAAAICIALVPLALWLCMAVRARTNELHAALSVQRYSVEVVSEHVLKLLDTQGLLIDIVERVVGNRDCPALRSDAQFQDLLRLSAQESPDGTSLWIVDADGYICMVSEPKYVDERNRSFREYFSGARDAGPGHHYVTRAFMAITPPVPTFNISKARWKDGVFNGVIVAAPSLANLIEYWNKILDPATAQRISLFRPDGATIARSWPPLVPLADAEVERRVAAAFTAPDGTNRGHSVVDGRPRIGAWHTLPNWNVVVSSSANEMEVMAPWRKATLIQGVLTSIISALLGTTAWLLLRGRQVLEQTVEERTRALAGSEARLKLATEGAGVGTWELDLASGRGRRSPETMTLLGVQSSEFTSGNWLEEVVHLEDRPRFAACWARATEDGAPYEIEFRSAAAAEDGERWLAAYGRIERGADGRPVRAAGILIDVTARRRAETALGELNRQLEERVRTEVAAREEAQARAAHAQRMQALGQLAGGIAHDFNNVLQAVQSGAEMIEMCCEEPETVQEFDRIVLDSAQRGMAITRRLLAFSRRGDLRAKPIDPVRLLDSMRDILAQTLGSPIAVRIETPPGLPAVMADRGQLETVLVNLATNARDAMPDGGALTLGAMPEDVRADAVHGMGLRPGRYVRLSIADTGTGMDPETLGRAMEPFFTTKSREHGTGLGLSMAKGFAEQSGGTLEIESAPGRGTIVTLWLPAADARTEAASEQTGPAPASGRAHRVLLVDDEASVRRALAAGLDKAGIAVLAAESGMEAITMLDRGETVDVLVSDLSMPGMGGLTLIREAHLRRPGLPAILLTGYVGEAANLAADGAPCGAFSLLRKPVSTAHLIDMIEASLAARAQERSLLH